MPKPIYFDEIEQKAKRQWDTLESDPELAAPWHQLFKQVQNPRHVLSELLQNADDAGAKEASAEIINGEFVFSHNGEDFTKEHFRSICSFGFSNKRVLHTIGFRGIGFKSTFSLGDEIRLSTPTLSVVFTRNRFSEPIWENRSHTVSNTEIRVRLKDDATANAMAHSLEAWQKSPISLLFFPNIRHLRINNSDISWITTESGPVNGSKWMTCSQMPESILLALVSEPREFPKEAIEEINDERIIHEEEAVALPPCQVEIVLGYDGRLFVVLPTDVRTSLPFACNAPFIQDPGRLKIKEFSASATNRWLFERIGRLAASAMLEWLGNQSLSIEEREKAYGLMPDVDRENKSLEGICATAVEEAFERAIEEKKYVLTKKGSLAKEGECIAVPNEIHDVWSENQIVAQFGQGKNAVLSSMVESGNREKLENWNAISVIDIEDILNALKSNSIAKPQSRQNLLNLWEYLEPILAQYRYVAERKAFRIVPVRGKKELYAAEHVVQLGEKRILERKEDWELLSDYVLVFDRVFSRFLTEQKKTADLNENAVLQDKVWAAESLQRSLGLNELSNLDKVMSLFANLYFGTEKRSINDSIRVAHIAAKLNASIPQEFSYYPKNEIPSKKSRDLVIDMEGSLQEYVSEKWYERYVLSEKYYEHYESCTKEEWNKWVHSDKSMLSTFFPFSRINQQMYNRGKLEAYLKARGLKRILEYPFKSSNFYFEDWDFSTEHWKYWESIAAEDTNIWGKLMDRILAQPKSYWANATSLKAYQIAQTGSIKPIPLEKSEKLVPAWIYKFRSLKCLKDTKGQYRQPADLLRRTAETEPLLEVESFVAREYDIEFQLQLLSMLGVRDTPTSPAAILERLKALSQASKPPINEVEKWYLRLNEIAQKCNAKHLAEISGAFESARLVYTQNESWAYSKGTFIVQDEETAPGALVVHHRFRDLSLWAKIGMTERPTAEIAIAWLKQLETGKKLAPDELGRVKLLLPKYPIKIWSECGYWLNLEGELHPTGEFEFALTMQSNVNWEHLYSPVKRRTADLRKIPDDACSQPPFSNLARLADKIENSFAEPPRGKADTKGSLWLALFGRLLKRAVFDNEERTDFVRTLASRLAETVVYISSDFELVPYINKMPVGNAKRCDAFWQDKRLYVVGKTSAQKKKRITDEIGRAFGENEISEALKFCVYESDSFIREYFEEYFNLEDEQSESEAKAGRSAQATATGSDADGFTADAGYTSEPDTDGTEEDDEGYGDDTEDGTEDETLGYPEVEQQTTRVVRQREQEASVVERWFQLNGFLKRVSDGSFLNDQQELIRRETGMVFPWIKYSAQGTAVHYYWGKRHCLEREPLAINAEIWELCIKEPDTHSLILSDLEGRVVEYTGSKLIKLLEGKKLNIYPAQYRIEFLQ